MAIKRINREEIMKRGNVTPKVTPEVKEEVVDNDVEEVVNETVEETPEEEVVNEIIEEETENLEEEVTEKQVVKKSLSKKVKANPISGKSGATVYSKEKLAKNIASKLEERFDNIDVKDAAFIFNKVEEAIAEAAQEASLRFLGGTIKTITKNVMVSKSPTVDYTSYVGERKVYTLTGSEIGQPEKYRGTVSDDKTKFIVSNEYDYETKKWVEATGEIQLS